MKKKSKIILILIIIVLIAGGLYIFYFYGKEKFIFITGNHNKKVIEKEHVSEEDIAILAMEKQKADNVPKLNKGKDGDISPAEITDIKISGNRLDLKKKEYIKITMGLKDISGIYRVRLQFFYNDKIIGYMQKNPNTTNEFFEEVFDIDNSTLLDGLKTFKDYEGAKIFYKITVWDNNMNEKIFNYDKPFEVIDNTPPAAIKAYWTYMYENPNDIEIYNGDLENKFMIYRIKDLPILEENKVVKYEYGYMDFSGNVLLKVGLDPFEEERKEIKIKVDTEGKYKFFARAYDLNGNFSEKLIKFYVDTTPPEGQIEIKEGMDFYTNSVVNVKVTAKDNLSGIFRYRVGSTKDEVVSKEWEEYKTAYLPHKVPPTEGFHEVWCQLQDNAFNSCAPFKANYYARYKTTIDINARSGDKERITGVEQSGLDQGKIKIKNYQER